MGLKVTRHVGESVLIGEDIKVTVERRKGGALQLDIEAPALTRILRSELLDPKPARLHNRRRTAVV